MSSEINLAASTVACRIAILRDGEKLKQAEQVMKVNFQNLKTYGCFNIVYKKIRSLW